MSKMTAEQRKAWAIRKRRRDEKDLPRSSGYDAEADPRSIVDLLRACEFKGTPNHHLFRVKIPATPPPNICSDCLNRWIRGMADAREAGVLERRAVECCHGADGSRYNVAFVVRGSPPSWVCMDGIEPSEWNGIYEKLVIRNGCLEAWQSALRDMFRGCSSVSVNVKKFHRRVTV